MTSSAPILVLRQTDIGAQRGVSGDIGDCGVGITLQMCNRVTNPEILVFFSGPG